MTYSLPDEKNLWRLFEESPKEAPSNEGEAAGGKKPRIGFRDAFHVLRATDDGKALPTDPVALVSDDDNAGDFGYRGGKEPYRRKGSQSALPGLHYTYGSQKSFFNRLRPGGGRLIVATNTRAFASLVDAKGFDDGDGEPNAFAAYTVVGLPSIIFDGKRVKEALEAVVAYARDIPSESTFDVVLYDGAERFATNAQKNEAARHARDVLKEAGLKVLRATVPAGVDVLPFLAKCHEDTAGYQGVGHVLSDLVDEVLKHDAPPHVELVWPPQIFDQPLREVGDGEGGKYWFQRLTTLVAPTKSGKTTFAVAMAAEALLEGIPVLYASAADNSRTDLLKRFGTYYRATRQDDSAGRSGPAPRWGLARSNEAEGKKAVQALADILKDRVYVPVPALVVLDLKTVKTAGLKRMTADLVVDEARALSSAHKGRAVFVVVDYLQALGDEEDTRRRVGDAIATLADLSHEGHSVLAVSSTARESVSYGRDGKVADNTLEGRVKTDAGGLPQKTTAVLVVAERRSAAKRRAFPVAADYASGKVQVLPDSIDLTDATFRKASAWGKESGDIELYSDTVLALVPYRDGRTET